MYLKQIWHLIIEKYYKTKKQILSVRQNIMRGAYIRSMAKLINENEKPTNYFLSLEKHNFTSKIIPKIETNDGKILTDQPKIVNETKNLYQKLKKRWYYIFRDWYTEMKKKRAV